MGKQVDSFRFVPFLTRKVLQAWIKREPAREIPWTALRKPLPECKVAVVSTAGIATANDRPFDQEGERRNPWWGDPSHRLIPRDVTQKDLRFYHLHVDPSYAQRDFNCVLPLQRLIELERAGEIGASAATHYSFMGYILQPQVLLSETTPAMIHRMQSEQVDLVLLVPF